MHSKHFWLKYDIWTLIIRIRDIILILQSDYSYSYNILIILQVQSFQNNYLISNTIKSTCLCASVFFSGLLYTCRCGNVPVCYRFYPTHICCAHWLMRTHWVDLSPQSWNSILKRWKKRVVSPGTYCFPSMGISVRCVITSYFEMSLFILRPVHQVILKTRHDVVRE